MRLTSEVANEKYFVLDIEPEYSMGECMLFLYLPNTALSSEHSTWVRPSSVVQDWDDKRNTYTVGEWSFVRYTGHVNYTLVIADRDGVEFDICEFRPSAMQLIVEWAPRLAKTAELYKVGANRVIHREHRVARINKFIPIKRLKIKSLITE